MIIQRYNQDILERIQCYTEMDDCFERCLKAQNYEDALVIVLMIEKVEREINYLFELNKKDLHSRYRSSKIQLINV
jgi:hypothetical protein